MRQEQKEIYGKASPAIRGELNPNQYGFKAFEWDIVPRINPGAQKRNCQMNCEGCYQQPYGEMVSLPKFESVLQEALDLKLGGCYLLGGEPTRHDNFFEIMTMIASTSLQEKILVSNIVDFSELSFLQRLLDSGDYSDWLLVSKRWVLGNSIAEREAFNQTAHSPRLFEKVRVAWTNVMRHWPGKICLQFCITKPLLKFLPAVYEWGLQNSDKIVKVSPEMVRQGQGRQREFPFTSANNQDVSPEELRKLFQQFAKMDGKYHLSNGNFLRSAGSPGWKMFCTLPFDTLHITTNGDVIPCGGTPAVYGNIYRQSFEAIMQSAKRHFFQKPKDWIVGPCQRCPDFDYCIGGCRGEAYRAFRQYGVQCYRASNPYCVAHLLTKNFSTDYQEWIPESCNDCPLQDEPTCHL